MLVGLMASLKVAVIFVTVLTPVALLLGVVVVTVGGVVSWMYVAM